jgi:hypothetical protein
MKIKGLQDDFVKLKEDFDRAVHVEALRLVKETGESHTASTINYISNPSHREIQTPRPIEARRRGKL